MAKRLAFFFVVSCVITLAVVESLSGSTTAKCLNVNEAIHAYPCVDGKTSYVARTGLTSCVVSRDTDFGEARIPAGSAVYLNEDGKPFSAFLSHDTAIRGYTCRGGHGHGYSTAFYSSGELKLCWLASDQEVQGIPCMQASFLADVIGGTVGTHFYRNGKLRTCKISRDAVIQGRKFGQGDHIYLDADGRVQQK
jgi:hypothetical protein